MRTGDRGPGNAERSLLTLEIPEPGRTDELEFIAGSPRVALELRRPFTTYVFIEKSPDRVAALEALKREFRETRTIVIRKSDCNVYLRERVAQNSQIASSRNRALVLLDPFGMHVPWSTIAALAATRAIDVFLNFPVGMAIQRLLLRKPEKFTDAQRRRLDDYFGSPEWFDVLYKRRGKTLFGDENQDKIEASGKALLKWYRDRLRSIFSHVSKAALIRNTRGGHLYYLLLASHNMTGVKIADDILSAGETV